MFQIVPFCRYTIEVESVDDVAHQLVTNERGGVVRTWRHTIVVEALDDDTCRYEDEIDIDAGLLTPVVSAFARVFYVYRQRRWTRLAVLLAAAAEAPR